MSADRAAIVAALTQDNDTFALDDERTVRLRILPDEGARPFDEFDCYGQVAPIHYGYGSRDPRPATMNGNAEKLHDGRDAWWWQPPADVKRTDPGFAELRSHVRDLLAYGMIGVVVELVEDTDAYGRGIVREVASLWGIEPFPTDDYRREIIADLLEELSL